MKNFILNAYNQIAAFLAARTTLSLILMIAAAVLLIIFLCDRFMLWKSLFKMGHAQARDSLHDSVVYDYLEKLTDFLKGGKLRAKITADGKLWKIPFLIFGTLIMISFITCFVFNMSGKLTAFSNTIGILALFILKWSLFLLLICLLSNWSIYISLLVALTICRYTSWFFTYDGTVLLNSAGSAGSVFDILIRIVAIPVVLYLTIVVIEKAVVFIETIFLALIFRIKTGISGEKGFKHKGIYLYSWQYR